MNRCQSLARDSSGVGSSDQGSGSELGSGKGKKLGRKVGWFRDHHFTETNEPKKNNRGVVQCNQCSTRMESRNDKLQEHILHDCKKISQQDRSSALDEVEEVIAKADAKRPPTSLSRTSLKKDRKEQQLVGSICIPHSPLSSRRGSTGSC